jgi:MFS family permease
MFHHQWYAATLMPLVFYILLKLDSSFGDTTGRRAYLLSILIISSAITIIHPITGFMTSLALILYALVRRRALGTAVASLCIYLGWWAFVTMSYIGNAWAFVQAFLGGNLVAGFVARSFTAQPALPFYDSIARNVYKAYYLLALALSLIIVVAVLTKKIKSINRVVVGIVLTSGCALVSVLVFFPFGLGSVLWEDRVYWHIPIPLAIACTLSLIVLSSAFSKYVPRKLRKLKIEYFVFFVVFSGLICSSLLLFAMNFYTLYYSPSSDRQLSIWAVAHSENGSKFAVGNTFRPPAYYAILYGKNIDASRSYPATWKSLDDLLRPLKEANLTIYTAHLESSWQTGMNNLGYSIDNETARNAIRSILDQQNIIFSDGKNIVYQFP